MDAQDLQTRVIPMSRLKLMLPAITCSALGLFFLLSVFMRWPGKSRRMIANPAVDATLISLIGLGLIALALSSLRPLIAGHRTVPSPDGVTTVDTFSDRFIGWDEIVSVEVPTVATGGIWLLRWQPSRFERLWTTRFAAIIDVRHTPWSIRDVLHAMIELHPPLEARMDPDMRSRYL